MVLYAFRKSSSASVAPVGPTPPPGWQPTGQVHLSESDVVRYAAASEESGLHLPHHRSEQGRPLPSQHLGENAGVRPQHAERAVVCRIRGVLGLGLVD
jgi:hypothetical protein